MTRLIGFILFTTFVFNANGQEVFQRGNYYGLKYEGVEQYAAVFEEIEVKEYFAYGKIGEEWFNLSVNKDMSKRAYRKFNFSHWNSLLVIGYRVDGNVDILNESGEFFYVENGDFSKVVSNPKTMTYQGDNLILTKREGQYGLYDWTRNLEILPPNFDKIAVHEDCEHTGYFIYHKKDGLNSVVEKGEVKMRFKSQLVDDMFPSDICQGYMIKSKGKKGYCFELRSGKYFLIKPKYDEIAFPFDNTEVILVRRGDNFGLYYNYQLLLKPRYQEIELYDDHYLLAKVTKRSGTYLVSRAGEINPE